MGYTGVLAFSFVGWTRDDVAGVDIQTTPNSFLPNDLISLSQPNVEATDACI
jgi:hypothetical protein